MDDHTYNGVVAMLDGDHVTAARELRLAAEGGDASAQHLLSHLFQDGQGGPQDHVKSAQWCRRAAERGLAHAQWRYGLLYLTGRGVPKDNVQAYAWFETAAAQDDTLINLQDRLLCEMTPAELREAQERSREYFEMFVVPFREVE